MAQVTKYEDKKYPVCNRWQPASNKKCNNKDAECEEDLSQVPVRSRWALDFEDQYCRRRSIKMKPGTTRNDGLQELAKHLAEVDRGTFVLAKKTPTFKQVADDWLRHKKLQSVGTLKARCHH